MDHNRGWHYAKLSLSNALCILLFLFLSLCRFLCVCVFLLLSLELGRCSSDLSADHVPDWQPRIILLGMVEARSVTVKKTTTTTLTQIDDVGHMHTYKHTVHN